MTVYERAAVQAGRLLHVCPCQFHEELWRMAATIAVMDNAPRDRYE